MFISEFENSECKNMKYVFPHIIYFNSPKIVASLVENLSDICAKYLVLNGSYYIQYNFEECKVKVLETDYEYDADIAYSGPWPKTNRNYNDLIDYAKAHLDFEKYQNKIDENIPSIKQYSRKTEEIYFIIKAVNNEKVLIYSTFGYECPEWINENSFRPPYFFKTKKDAYNTILKDYNKFSDYKFYIEEIHTKKIIDTECKTYIEEWKHEI